jgi:hypothetical protein
MAAHLRVAAVSLSVALLATAQAQRINDAAVFGVLQRADPTLFEMRVIHRVEVTAVLDLVIAIGTPRRWELGPPEDVVWWNAERKLGLFLQERSNPAKVFMLAIQPGPEECAARILRATATDTIIECRGEKSDRYPNRKFVYDVRAKAVVQFFEYRPFSMTRAVAMADGAAAVIVGARARIDAEEERPIAIEFVADRIPEFLVLGVGEDAPSVRLHRSPMSPVADEARFGARGSFRVMPAPSPGSSMESRILEGDGGAVRSHELPATTYRTFAAARPRRVKDGYDSQSFVREYIGPWQLEGDRLWFGKTFYDGEGMTGVGGFGYFDSSERRFHLFAAPETADWSASAILVQSDAIWLALASRGEFGDANGGLVRFDRQAETYRRFESGDIGRSLALVAGHLVAATDNGITVIAGTAARHYVVDQTTDGRLRVAPAAR